MKKYFKFILVLLALFYSFNSTYALTYQTIKSSDGYTMILNTDLNGKIIYKCPADVCNTCGNYSQCTVRTKDEMLEAFRSINLDLLHTNIEVFDNDNGIIKEGVTSSCTAYIETNYCKPLDTKPAISADKSKTEWQNNIGDITLSTEAPGKSKYIWDKADECSINGKAFSDGDKIQIPWKGKHKLYLCAEIKPNECSEIQSGTWVGDYWLDESVDTCNNDTLPTNFSNFIFSASNATVYEVYSYNGPLCGYVCKDGYVLDKNGTETNKDDICVLDTKNKCNASTKPANENNMIFKGVDGGNITYTPTGEKCSYSCETGYVLDNNNTPTNYTDDFCKEKPEDKCDSSTKPSDPNMIFKGENDSPTGTIAYTHNSAICGYVCKEGTLDENGTATSSDDTCSSTPPECSDPGKPSAFTESTMSYNSNTCTYSCKDTTKNYNTHQTNNTLDDTCDSKTGGNSCGAKPTNTTNMIFIGTDNATQANQPYKYNSQSCGYKCDTNYKLKANGTGISDDICEFDISTCTSGIITEQCPCKLDMNKNLSVCTPGTIPGEGGDPATPGTIPGEIGVMDRDLLANTYTYRISIPVGEDESPISYFTYRKELLNGSMSEVLTTTTLKFPWNMTDVDSDREADGSREYTFHLIEVCDSADNCKVINKKYTHKVYANTTQFNTTNLTFGNNGIADGTIKSTKITLKGVHGNEVVPSSGIDRTIDFNFNVDNTVYQDQYTNSRNAVFVTEANGSDYANRIALGNNLNQLNHQNSTNGAYDFKFRFYAPTNTENIFKLNSLSVDVNGKLGNVQNYSLATNKTYNFTPLYDVKFSNDFNELKSQHTQSGTILLERDNNSNKNLDLNNSDSIILESDGTKKSSFDFKYNINGNNLNTLFTFVGGVNSYLSDFTTVTIKSGVKYINDGKYIRYKTSDSGTGTSINRLKINGNSNIDTSKQRDAIEGQGDKDVHNLSGKIDKATLKRNIKRNAFKLTRGMNSGTELNGIKYFECSNGEIEELNNYYGTIILKGCNAYITDNVNIGGIIILKNSNGNGGKLYINPSVTEIQAAIYTDKSIFSYDGSNELSSSSNYSTLTNQLYIYGAVFSENTIGGSLKTPPVCPYYVSTCTREEAQKYDLNFLRSGFENKSDDSLGDYPVIITYNPAIQTNPPKGFSE